LNRTKGETEMGFKDDLKKAAYSAVPRKIEMGRSMTIEELYALLSSIRRSFQCRSS
jgi:hypothetical protein